MVKKKKKEVGDDQSARESQASDAPYAPVAEPQPLSEPENEAIEDLLNEVVDYAIIKLDAHGAIKSWNKGAENIKGYSAEEIIGKNYRIFYTSEDKSERLSDKLLMEAKENARTSYEGWRVRKDGTRFWGSMTLTALHDKNGEVSGFLKVTRDLTARKTAEDKYSNFVEELRLKNDELKLSEERYHKMVSEVMDYAIILLDPDGRILDWNKGAEKLKGYSSSEIVGKNFRLFYPKEEKDNRLPERLLEQALRNGSTTHDGWRIKKSGERFWGSVVITALHDDRGNTIGFSKVTRDLTDRKLAEDRLSNLLEELHQTNDALKKSEQRYHRMIAEVQDYAIILLDAEGNIENWNAGAEQIKGYKSAEIVGKNFRVFYLKEDQAAGLPIKLLNQAKVNGKVSHEGWRLRKNGSRFWGSVVITALHDDNNNVVGYSKVTRDLTEKKLADDSLKKTSAQLELKTKALERVNGELSSFTYVASHDLKEPLRKIKTFAARIKDVEYSPVKVDDFVDKILGSATKMQLLIENLLAYSLVSNNEEQFETVDLNVVLDSVKQDLEIVIAEKRAVIDSDNLPIISGINFQMHQMFLNLVSNSLKFSKENEPPIIRISAKTLTGPDVPGTTSNRYHHISVADQGIGFPKEQSDKIFEAFHRLNKKGPISGSGIGLAIVKKIVENHSGIISAESSINKGAVFNIYLPINSQIGIK